MIREAKQPARSLILGIILIIAIVTGGIISTANLTTHQWEGPAIASLDAGNVHADGWVEENATLNLSGFSRWGNYIEFVFNPWRPPSEGIGQVAVSVCGGAEQILTAADRAPVRIGLRNGCSPASVTLRSLNPFVPAGGKDSRRLSVRLERLEVSSRLGFPIPDFSSALIGIMGVGAIALLVLGVFQGLSMIAALASLGGVVAAVVLTGFADVPASRFEPLWVVIVALLAGLALEPRLVGVERRSIARPGIVIAGIVLLGAALRLYGINFGLPYNFHPDEVPKVNAIMRMVDQNTWNPQYFLHPSLLLYCTYFVNVILQAIGVDGSFRDTAFLAGRIVSATAGTISIYLTYAIGRRLFSSNVGLISSLTLAVLPLHVTCSRYLKEDALLTFVVLSCVVTTLIAVQSERRWVLLIAGLLAGATAGTKYSGILMAGVPASAPWLASRRLIPDWKWVPWAAAAVLISPLGFLATTPYAVFDSAKFIKDFESESHHMQTGHTTSIDPWSQLWMYHFWRSIVPGMTAVVAVSSVVGLGMLLRRARIEDLLIVGMFLLFYLPAEFVKAKPAPQPERYIVPCLPFMAIALGEAIRLVTAKVRVPAGSAVMCMALLALPFMRTAELAKEVRNDTREQLAAWMSENIPAGSKVLMDWKPYCPRLDGHPIEVIYIPRARIIPELDVRALKNSGADYLVLSSLFYDRYFSQPESNPILRQRIREVFERVPIVRQVAPENGTYGFHNPVLTLFSLKEQDFARLESEIVQKRQGQLAETSNEMRARAKW